ncbi:MAG: small multi-drug resistant family protein [Henriciella sp.]
MSLQIISLIMISVLLSAGSQIVLKKAMIADSVQKSIASGDVIAISTTLITSPMILAGLFSFGLSAVFWLFVLSKVPLSSAYPFVALGIGITVIAGVTIFGETVSPVGAIGVGLIVLGILCVGSQA